jgi:4-diphosphocytidyl-2-C-methyl-D-erythritol kinase
MLDPTRSFASGGGKSHDGSGFGGSSPDRESVRSSAHNATVTVRAPAKLNLGLEIINRRSDGFHELVTIFQAISIFDTLSLGPASDPRFTCDAPELENDDNLALVALRRLRREHGIVSGCVLHLAKHIPAAAGLGGASSDAAATLLAGRDFWRLPVTDQMLHAMATELGSDVPFFLRGGTALATGRGEVLAPLPTPRQRWFVVVSPLVRIARKTATLYSALTPADFSSGAAVRAQAARLHAGAPIDPDLLVNGFARALISIHAEFADLPGHLRRHGAPNVALSGAGPSHYTLLDDPEEATHLAASLTRALGRTARVFTATAVVKPPTPVTT